MAVGSKDELISKQKAEIDHLHAAVDEASRSISGLNEKVSKSESQRKEVGSKLESAQSEISKLSQELGTKVNLFAQLVELEGGKRSQGLLPSTRPTRRTIRRDHYRLFHFDFFNFLTPLLLFSFILGREADRNGGHTEAG